MSTDCNIWNTKLYILVKCTLIHITNQQRVSVVLETSITILNFVF
jgi:hypothetical protein